MNTKVLEYFDGRMNDREREQFEKELAENPVLRAELEQLRSLNAAFAKAALPVLPVEYASGIIPRFREKQSNGAFTQFTLPQAVFSGAFSFVVLGLLVWYFTFLPMKNTIENPEGAEVLAYLDETVPVQTENLLTDAFTEAAAEQISAEYNKALHITTDDVSSLIDVAYDNHITDGSTLLSDISDEDAEYLVAELSKKNNP